MCVFIVVFFGSSSFFVVSSLRGASGCNPCLRYELNALLVSFRYDVGIVSGELYREFLLFAI